MKYIKILLLTTVFLISTNLFADTKKIKVSGMVCAYCANGIEKKFSKEASVEKVTVDLDTKWVTLKFKEGKSIDDDQIKKLITSAGYHVVSIEKVK